MRIEQRLKQLAEGNPNYSLLWAQWEFDKKLLSRALNTVSRDFPHYSLHDASHSSTIITQIEKVISPNIYKLTATDCWLLLESCYWHDAGMVITNEEKKELLRDPSFHFYLEELSQNESELSKHAKEILQRKNENDIIKALSISNSLTFVLADYFRKLHADRSGHFVKEPSKINVFSPRTSLIPQRLFNFVAQIVQCHGRNPDAILELAKYNDGMDAEDYAHPRYIAALLRIGDLLDIDDGRFCPTLLANIGNVPVSSKNHQEKHASIKHLFINSEVIEIKAECEQYGAYHAQQGWFNYIQNEFDYQKRVWNEIVPDSDFRALPTIGILECRIKDYIAIDGKVPKITLNPKRVYEYITGSQIYSEKYPFVRELLQNSIDATYYKVWDELISNSSLSHDDVKDREFFINELEKYKIELLIEEYDSEEGVKFNSFIIKDFALGMDINDIRKILVVGSESVELIKKLNRTMPDWAKPSGYFGIGLQTVFKLCDEVVIKTRKKENPCYEIKVINNADNEFFDISIKELDDRRFEGTEIKSIFKSKNENFINYRGRRIENYEDPLLLEQKNDFYQNVMQMLTSDFKKSHIPLIINKTKLERRVDVENKEGNVFMSDYSLGADFSIKINMEDYIFANLSFKYKGVEFDTSFNVKCLVGELDIFKNSAGYWLTIDRKKGRTDRHKEIEEIITYILENHSSNLRENTKDDKLSDFYLYSVTGKSINYEWKQYEINGIKLEQYISGENDLFVYEHKYGFYIILNLMTLI